MVKWMNIAGRIRLRFEELLRNKPKGERLGRIEASDLLGQAIADIAKKENEAS